jgi:putative transcriptional regulator
VSKAGERLIGAAREALSIAKGEKEAPRIFIPADIDVRGIRTATKLSQEDFAATFGFTVAQIRDWEQHRSRPLGGVRAYLMLILTHPEQMLSMLNDLRAKRAAGCEAA